jgi:hypothetical protein
MSHDIFSDNPDRRPGGAASYRRTDAASVGFWIGGIEANCLDGGINFGMTKTLTSAIQSDKLH